VGDDDVRAARKATPDWHWRVLGADRSTWVEDPSAVLAEADVVVTHAGQNALAETAAARRPAVVLPQSRPHDEQRTTAEVLAGGWPALVHHRWPAAGEWADVLERAAALDPARWSGWCDGRAADRFADVVLATRARVRGEVLHGGAARPGSPSSPSRTDATRTWPPSTARSPAGRRVPTPTSPSPWTTPPSSSRSSTA
jgi:hypothetical protein